MGKWADWCGMEKRQQKRRGFHHAEPWGYHAPKQNTGKTAPRRVPRMDFCSVEWMW